MTLADLAAAAVAELQEQQRQRERAEREQQVAAARGAVEAVLGRASLDDAGLTQVTSAADGALVWHDGTTGLLARRVGGVWAVFVARRSGTAWRPTGGQVHSLLDVARVLGQT